MSEPIIVEQTINAPAHKVWQALTDKDQIKQWYFDIADFKAERGEEFQFTGSNEGRTYVHLCKITAVVPERKLAYTWRYDGYDGNSLVTFELLPQGDITRVKLTHEGVETFTGHPDFARENFIAGWTEIIGRLLKNYVETAED